MKETIRLAIADDYPMFLEGLKLILHQYPYLSIVGEAANAKSLVQVVDDHAPDVVITDIQMPDMDGIVATKIISEKFPATKVLALSMYGEYHLIVDMMEAGAMGYLLKDTMKDDLLDAIDAVMDGKIYYCRTTNMLLAKMLSKSNKGTVLDAATDVFTEKEKEVIRLLCEEYATKEIADATNLTHSTVETYRKKILDKIGCRNVAGVVVYAVRTGLFRVGSI